MTTAEAIAKIKKLLRMKHGGTPDEVAKAFELARKLAARYGIDLDGVNASLDTDRWSVRHEEVKDWPRVPVEIHIAGRVVQRYFDVDWIICHRLSPDGTHVRCVLNIIGSDLERMLAGHLVIFLAQAMGRAWKKGHGRLRNRTAFMKGFAAGVDAALGRLRPPRPKTEALAISLRGYMSREFGETKPGRTIGSAMPSGAVNAGWVAGRSTAVNRPVTGSQSRPALAAVRLALPPPVGQLALI